MGLTTTLTTHPQFHFQHSKKQQIKMAAIASIATPVMAKVAPVASKSSQKALPLKAASPLNKAASAFVSNGTEKKTSAMMVWTPVNNKFFETFSFLPPLPLVPRRCVRHRLLCVRGLLRQQVLDYV